MTTDAAATSTSTLADALRASDHVRCVIEQMRALGEERMAVQLIAPASDLKAVSQIALRCDESAERASPVSDATIALMATGDGVGWLIISVALVMQEEAAAVGTMLEVVGASLRLVEGAGSVAMTAGEATALVRAAAAVHAFIAETASARWRLIDPTP